jgi:hypothetical protein
MALHDVLGERYTDPVERGWREVRALVAEVMRRASHGSVRAQSPDV